GEASRIRAERGDYLLAYRRDFLVVEHHYVRTLGLDPEDPDWQRIGRDWAQPGDLAARERLFRQVALDRLTALGFLPESRRHAPPAR
ncbi:MAG: hypothetical protein KDE27_32650, partial [Planctomycetes bacterium]|nr:hypothetical protein [Planctomycetota bacterium]